MEAVELHDVGSAQWDAVLDGEQHAWGGDAEDLAWARKTHHVGVLDDDGRPLALAGALVAQVAVAGGDPFPVVGIGGVIVTRSRRGQGLGRDVVTAVMTMARGMGPERAMLFCRQRLMALYARFGFLAIEADVTAEQPSGRITVPMRAMWAPLVPGADWPAGEVAVLGEPF